MKKITIVTLLSFSIFGYAQEIKRCGTHEALLHQNEIHPGYLNQVNETFYRAKNAGNQDRSETYIIPVVVHVVYNTPAQNIPDSVIFNQIEILTNDFSRLNADTINMRTDFETIVGSANIEFKLATKDPDGNPTTGITRTSTTITEFGGLGVLMGDMGDFERVKSTSQGGIDPWDQNRYLNIWVCNMSVFGFPVVMGYATPPDGLPHWPPGAVAGLGDGVVLQFQAVGSNNPNTLAGIDFHGRTGTHEVGHYLGLRHIWGDGDCTAQDGIDDTPNADAASDQDCDITKNTCVDDILTLGDLPDMIENFMDYSAEDCQNSFTIGQIELMRAVLENERFDLINDNPALGIDKHTAVEHFDIYPNPSNGEVYISHLSNQEKNIVVYNTNGQIVQEIKTTENQVYIQNLETGFYIIKIIENQKILTTKLSVVNS